MTTSSRIYDDCFIIYKYFQGKNILRIEREMRSLGHNFHRRTLYSRGNKPGWIKKYGWEKHLSPKGTEKIAQGKAEGRHPGYKPVCESLPEGEQPTADCIAPVQGADVMTDARQLPTDFHAWLKRVSPTMHWDWKHQLRIIKQLEKVTSGECKRLMIFLPPRHGKSELVTVRYSAWRMQRDPSLNMILGSYNQQLANRFSRKVRRVISDSEHLKREVKQAESAPDSREGGFTPALQSVEKGGGKPPFRTVSDNVEVRDHPSEMFPFSSSRRANTIAEWETAAGGGFRAVGVGGGVTGFGASLIVIDDPVKSRAEAESETYRENLWDWFNDDLYTRLEPDGAVILIQTRWHEDDLAGRLLKEMHNGGEHWDVIDLPAIRNADALVRNEGEARTSLSPQAAIADEGVRVPSDWRQPGQALCPERFDENALEKIKRKLGTYSFSALYQQRPTPSDGGTFKREWFKKIIPYAPSGLKWKRGYDLAVSTKTTADHTASFRCAFDKEGNLYIAGGFRKRIEFPEQRRFIIERVRAEPDTEHGIELALHGQALIQDLRREPGVRGHLLRGIRADADKLTRALAWAPLAEEGKVILVRGPWIDEFIDEAAAFPLGHHDDQIDAVSLAVQMLKKPASRGYGF
ncbi:MAG TPA: phage terminase large subunit [Pyrinomonadaceae bacterium]|nr:phage terminase large subunit [Pyrinomonadaceae bacterium]